MREMNAADAQPQHRSDDTHQMAQPALQDLLEAGVHFGHQTRRWNPKMRRFIFAERSGIYIIDLQKTLRQIQKAQELLKNVVLRGEGVLFVCTKKQLKGIVQTEAAACNSFYVTERWLGGMLTNFQTVKKQIRRLRDLEQGATEGDFENYTKKEKLLFERERVKLARNLEGIKMMNRLPGALFVVDAKKEKIAVAEANKLGIPVVAIVDTNCAPDDVDYVVPGNDDAMRAIALYAEGVADAALDGKSALPEVPTGEDEFVELDEEGRPKPKSGAPAPRRGGRPAAVRKKQAPRRRLPEKMPEAEPVEEVVAAEVDDVEADVSPEEFMARRKAALAKRKPTTPGAAAPAEAAPADAAPAEAAPAGAAPAGAAPGASTAAGGTE